jgi:hypothetical protein
MRFPAISAVRSTRTWFSALLVGAIFCGAAPAAHAAFGVEKFFAAECNVSTCGEFGGPALKNSELFTQAAGHPNYGITDFRLKSKEQTAPFTAFIPEGNIESLRVDVPAGLSTNPESVPQCSQAEFTPENSEVAPGTFLESTCKPEDQIGTDTVTVAVEVAPGSGIFANVPLVGKIYTFNDPTNGLSAEWGIEIPLEGLEPTKYKGLFSHTLLEGHVSWNTDYHEYFTIKEISKTLPLLESRLVFEGNKGTGGFLTNPSTCSGPQTSSIQVHSYQGESESTHYETTEGASGCNLVPFEPSIALKPATTQSDQADGATVELKVPQNPSASEPNSSDLNTASVTLPEGMTINPAAAYNLAACTEEQAGLTEKNGERTTGAVTCPDGSKIGTISIEVPTLPAKSLEGSVYLGSPTGAPITGPPYTIYFNAESKRYGVAVRQKGLIVPNKNGRLTATFAENPQAPFSSLSMNLTGGSVAGSVPPLANPLACGTAMTESLLIPYATGGASKSPFSSFTVDGNGSGGACPSPLPFALSQSTENQSSLAGALTSFKLNLARPEGQQYLSQVKTVLPAGLLGEIPSVTQCAEAQAASATCPTSSQIGTVAVAVGSGRPYPFNGSVYLTGPYNGAPYGMAIVVPAVAGPFNLGNVVTRATINVEPYTGRVVVGTSLPYFVNGVGLPESGIPLRLQKLTVAITRQSFLSNPTHCGALATESTLTGTVTPGSTGSTQSIATPFQVTECSKLAFKPSFSAVSGAKTSKANGASLEVKITQGAKQMNLRQVIFQLPKQLPSRATTLRKACPAATFETGPPPGGCTSSSVVGSATVTTPDLPDKLTGSAYMVSHANEAFPDLDLVLKGDGVTIVLVGHTHIATNGVTTSKFETLPDAPVSSVVVNLPVGPQSLLAANGNLCKSQSKLIAPTTMTGQNGRQIRKNIKVSVRNCPIVVVSHRTSGAKALITVKTPAAGRISGSGTDLKFTTRKVGKASQVTIGVPLTQTGAEVLRKYGRLGLKVRVGFVPKTGKVTSKAFATVTFRS